MFTFKLLVLQRTVYIAMYSQRKIKISIDATENNHNDNNNDDNNMNSERVYFVTII